MNSNATILVCFAVPEEKAFFRPPPQVAVLVSGMGKANAEKALRKYLETHNPKLVLTCGFAGGLNPTLENGALVYDADAGFSLLDKLNRTGARAGTFHCADRILVSASDKQNCFLQTRADAVEMESAVMRRICRERGIPSATLRVISDTANEDLPLDFNRLVDAEHRMQWGKLAFALLRSPGRIPELMRFQKRVQAAAKNLGQALEQITAP